MAAKHSKSELLSILNREAAKLAGVADTLREITESSGDVANIVGLLADVVGNVNDTVSDVAMQLERGMETRRA